MNQLTKEDFLVVSEKFYSIQGEGQTMGTPAVFLRLSGCNILCQSENWICDTIEVWKKGKKQYFNEILCHDYISYLLNGAHLVITGGEPMLHQKKILKFLKWFKKEHEWLPVIEVETNGTVEPSSELKHLVNYWNVSPKLENSGVSFENRFNPEAIKSFNSHKGTIFKFVISKSEDIQEVSKDYLPLIDQDKIYLMPAGENQEQLNKTRPIVVDLCKIYSMKYSERLHIVIWDKKTGV